jgi:DNA-binding SARP family transcriptional activator
VRYGVLGPLEVHDEDVEVSAPTAPKTACVLATLLLDANRMVLAESLMEDIWNGTPPPSASTTLQTYIYHLRCMLGHDTIVTRPGGYVLRVDEADLDLLRFRAGVAEGQALLKADRPDEAQVLLRTTLGLWRGRPVSNVRVGPRLAAEVQHIEEERRRAAELLVEAAFSAGRHRDIIVPLKQMVAEDPYNEWLHTRLMEALSIAGRRHEALHAFEDLRRMLADQLGLDPTPEMRALERRILES